MKSKIISNDNLDKLKSQMKCFINCFQKPTPGDLYQNFKKNFNIDLMQEGSIDIPDNLKLITSDELKPYSTDFENVKIIYGALSGISRSKASDERLWAGMCMSEQFWPYVGYRWPQIKEGDIKKIRSHFLFGESNRRSLTRNALARLWWIGALTYDRDAEDPWFLTKTVCESSDNIMHILEINVSNNLSIVRTLIKAILKARSEGYDVNTNVIGELCIYINMLGGIYLLDIMDDTTPGLLAKKIYNKATELSVKNLKKII